MIIEKPPKILFLGTEADRPFLAHLRQHVSSYSIRHHEFIEEIVLQYGKTGTTHIVTTQQNLIPMLCNTASAKEQTIDNYAGSWVTHEKSGMHFLFVHPLKQCVTVPHGKFLLERYISKWTKPKRWVTQDTFNWKILESIDDYDDALNNISNATLCAVDIETRPDLSISCVSYTCVFNEREHSYTTRTYVMPLPYNLELDDYYIRYQYLGKFNNTPDTPKILQNGKYDAAYLQRYNIPIAGYMFDTQLCHHAWYAELPKALDILATFYVRKSCFWKNEGDTGNAYDLYYYNALDTWHTAWVFLQWIAEAPEWAKHNYLLSFQTVAPNFLMESTGLAVNYEVFNEVKAEHEGKKEAALVYLRASIGNPNYNPGSPKQNLQLLRILGCSDVKSADSKIMKRVAHRHPFIALIVEKIMAYSKAAKLVGTYLNEEKHFNGRVLYSLNPTTDTGRNKSKSHHFWTGCLPVDIAEAYTPEGWVKIADRPKVIAQWNQDGTMEFVPAEWLHYDVVGENLITYDARCIKGAFTKDHRVPVIKANRPLRVDTWSGVAAKTLNYTPLSGILNTGSDVKIDDLWLARCVMASADGCLEHDSWRFTFTKQRKIDYFKKLNPEHRVQSGNRLAIKDEGYFKEFPQWFLTLPYASRLVILEELKYWDAHIIGDSYRYYTTIKSNAELVHTLAHITGMSASTWVNADNNAGYGSGNNKPLYTVNVSPKTLGSIEGKRTGIMEYTGTVGCPNVPSSFWLVRYDGGIHVTGNCNIQNIPRTGGIKRFIEADEGFLIGECDYAQAESRDTGYITGDPVLIDAVESDKDFHKNNASMFFGVPYEEVDKELRQLGKPVNHGANYLMAEDTLIDSMELGNVFKAQKRLGLPRFWTPKQVTKHLLSLFAQTYKVVSHDYPQYIKEQVRNTRMLVNAYGWTRYCFGDPIKNRSDLRALVAHLPQGTNAQALNLSVRLIFDRVWKPHYENFKMNAQIHDSLLFQYKPGHEHLADMVSDCMVEAGTVMVTDIKGVTRKMIIPTDTSLGGKSWADSKD